MGGFEGCARNCRLRCPSSTETSTWNKCTPLRTRSHASLRSPMPLHSKGLRHVLRNGRGPWAVGSPLCVQAICGDGEQGSLRALPGPGGSAAGAAKLSRRRVCHARIHRCAGCGRRSSLAITDVLRLEWPHRYCDPNSECVHGERCSHPDVCLDVVPSPSGACRKACICDRRLSITAVPTRSPPERSKPADRPCNVFHQHISEYLSNEAPVMGFALCLRQHCFSDPYPRRCNMN